MDKDKRGFFSLRVYFQDLIIIATIVFACGVFSSDFNEVKADVCDLQDYKADKVVVEVLIREIKTSIDNVEAYVKLLFKNELRG